MKNYLLLIACLFTSTLVSFCPIEVAPEPTIDTSAVQKADREGLIPLIKAYSPVLYLDPNEKYFPIDAPNYFASPWTAVKQHRSTDLGLFEIEKNSKVIIPSGKVTMEALQDLEKQNLNFKNVYIDTAACTHKGLDPKKHRDAQGNLTTPAYVMTCQDPHNPGKFYIQYIYLYGYNGPYGVSKDVFDFQGAHEFDLEHVTLEFDSTTQKLLRMYYGLHGSEDGTWIPADHPHMNYENGHPVIFVAEHSHGNYPRVGRYKRQWYALGLSDDQTGRGQRWTPKLVRLYPQSDSRYDKKTMGWMYLPREARYGARGIAPLHIRSWLCNPASEKGKSYSEFDKAFSSK